jgi:hypothetical protein
MSMNDTPLAAKGAAHRAGDAPLLEIDGLHTYFDTLAGEVRSVHGVSYSRRAPARRSAWSASRAAARA